MSSSAPLAEMSQAERGQIPGVKPGRGDIVLAAAVTIEGVLEVAEIDGIEATEAGMREGVFFARVLLAGREPLFDNVREAAVRNLAVQYECDLGTSSTWPSCRCRCLTRWPTGVFEPTEGERELLWAAAMLHDVGMTISYDDHHKHRRYLILGGACPASTPGSGRSSPRSAAITARARPSSGELSPVCATAIEEVLERCAVVLRVAEHLERGRDQSVHEVRLRRNGDGAALHLRADGDITLPRWSVERYGDSELFERAFGRRLDIE